MNINNRIALVTGGSRGLGRNIALTLAHHGADVLVAYRNGEKEATEVADMVRSLGRKAAVVQIDTGDSSSFGAFAATLEEILEAQWQRQQFDFLVNNAGINRKAPFTEVTEEDFDELMAVHFRGPFFLTRTLLPLLADGGGIVNISTGLARFSIPGYSAYAAMKGAVEVLTRYLAKELGPRGIRANVVAPGVIETDFTRETFETQPGAKDHLASLIALGRVGVPEDIGGVVAFLCSEEGRWINGQRLEASGGMLL